MKVHVEPLREENARAWEALFERAASPCFCRWWHFAGTRSDWLARCALEPDSNRAEMRAALREETPDALGLVALAEIPDSAPVAVGWMKLSPRASVPKLRSLPVYRRIDLGSDEGVWSVGCFLVDGAHRRHGVAGALLDAAPAFVRARGGLAIEAYPRHPHDAERARLHDEEALMGPESLFTARGFRRVAEGATMGMYPVYRLALPDA